MSAWLRAPRNGCRCSGLCALHLDRTNIAFHPLWAGVVCAPAQTGSTAHPSSERYQTLQTKVGWVLGLELLVE